MTHALILVIGPLSETPGAPSLYALMDERARLLATAEASDDTAGIAALIADGRDAITCEPALGEAARALGLPVEPPNRPQVFGRAELALDRAGLGLPVAEARAPIRSLFQGLGSLLGSRAWTRMGESETAMIVVKGSVEERRYDVDISATRSARAGPPRLRLLLAEHEAGETLAELEAADSNAIDVKILLEDNPAFVVKAIEPAYGLAFVPHISIDGAAPDAAWLERYAPIIGAAFYVLGDMDKGNDREQVELSDETTPFCLRVDAGFGPP